MRWGCNLFFVVRRSPVVTTAEKMVKVVPLYFTITLTIFFHVAHYSSL